MRVTLDSVEAHRPPRGLFKINIDISLPLLMLTLYQSKLQRLDSLSKSSQCLKIHTFIVRQIDFFHVKNYQRKLSFFVKLSRFN